MKKIIAMVLSVVMMFALATSALAVISPAQEKEEYKVITNIVSDVNGESVSNGFHILVSGDTIQLVVDEKLIGSFTHWTIEGGYEIVSGSLTDPVIVIRPLGDIVANIHLNTVIPDEFRPDGGKDTDNKSPDTSSAPLAGLELVMILSGALAVVAEKKIAD